MNRTPLQDNSMLPSDAEFERMKRSVLARIKDADSTEATEGIHPRPVSIGHHRRIVGGLGVAAAVALTATLVLTDLVGLAGWRGGADPAAAAVLNRAAEQMAFVDAQLDAGEYLHVESDAVHVSSGQGNGGPIVYYYEREFSDLFVPADRSGEWVWVRPRTELVRVITPGGDALIQENFDSAREEWGDEPERLRASGGAFYGSTNDGPWGDYNNLPRDPYRLLNYIYRATLGAGPSPDGEALVFIADTLRAGTAPADVREALLQAATLVPGVTITDEQANLDGVTGVAVGRSEGKSGLRQELIIDPDSGRLIGERQVVEDGGDTGLNTGDIFQWSTIRTSVVTNAPAGGTANGAFDVMGCVPGEQRGSWNCPPPKEENK